MYLYSDRDKTKARDRYIIISLNGDWCTVCKFTKSQFRSRQYDVRISDCYPVYKCPSGDQSNDPIRGLDYASDGSDSSVYDNTLSNEHINTPEIPVPPPVIPVLPAQPPPPDILIAPPEAVNTAQDIAASADVPVPVTQLDKPPGRIRKPPPWQTSSEWMMD